MSYVYCFLASALGFLVVALITGMAFEIVYYVTVNQFIALYAHKTLWGKS